MNNAPNPRQCPQVTIIELREENKRLQDELRAKDVTLTNVLETLNSILSNRRN